MTRSQRAALAAILLFAVAFVLWAVGREGDGGIDAPPRPVPSARATVDLAAGGGTLGIFVEPDDGREPILRELEAARESVTLQIYLLSDEEMIQALIGAAERGIRVRVLMEEHPFGGAGRQPETFQRLEENGVEIRWSDPVFRFSHVKTFVVDGETAIIMNLNLTKSAFTRNREFGAITTRPAEVAQAAAIFETDWARAGDEPGGPLIVSPTTSRARILAIIGGARRSLDIYAEVVRDEEVVGALAEAAERGVHVRLLVSADSDENDRGREERARLADFGVEIRLARGVYVHAKLVLADGERAYLGSQNFTATSLDLNREVGLEVDDPAGVARLVDTFEADFANARPEDL